MDHTQTRRHPSGHAGFTLIEILIVVIIIGILAAIAIPVYAAQRDKAKTTVLTKNARDVAIAATGYVLQGLNTGYRRSDEGSAAAAANATVYVSNALEVGIEQGVPTTNREHYSNPYSGYRSIVNWNNAPADSGYMPPAVFITNANSYRYANFPAAGTNTSRTYLRGAIIAAWNTTSAVNAIQIYWVGGDGKKGPLLHTIPLAK
jgi:prepilin-type N-terminal cleavage/methylation domain-containing protein